MRRRRVVCGLAVVALGPPSAPPAAATTVAPYFTVIGDGPASAEITPTKPLSFEFDDAEIVGAGRYGGILVWDVSLRGGHVGDVIAVASFGRFDPPVPAGKGIGQPFEVTLEAGRTYRVYLLADAHTEVRVRLTRGRGMTVRPATPHRQVFRVATSDVGPAATSPVALRLPLHRGRDMRHLMIGQFDTHPSLDPAVTACFAPRAATCARGEFAGTIRASNVGFGPDTAIIDVGDGDLGRRIAEARVEAEFTHIVTGKVSLAALSFQMP